MIVAIVTDLSDLDDAESAGQAESMDQPCCSRCSTSHGGSPRSATFPS